ncbi:hypothetical protein [Gluconacetobacter liquefaciens]|uniref:Uncharacterized protein n=1 Tax=Gluconacetobacter liquefaciens TaxID=89584 RepID=A0A7W4JJK2_GLULI|nr:hypothetical protein [Gluconacetobacter liquefaciens]MBB2185810.1 hypothetical protein [Gluconacetobacter liquefaciens]
MGNADLDNAISLNSTSFNAARMIRPHDEDRDRGNRQGLGFPDQWRYGPAICDQPSAHT